MADTAKEIRHALEHWESWHNEGIDPQNPTILSKRGERQLDRECRINAVWGCLGERTQKLINMVKKHCTFGEIGRELNLKSAVVDKYFRAASNDLSAQIDIHFKDVIPED